MAKSKGGPSKTNRKAMPRATKRKADGKFGKRG